MKMKEVAKLYEPRVNAYKAIKMHLDNVEMASQNWLYNRSVNALENISGEEVGEHLDASARDTVMSLQKQMLNEVSSRNLKTNFSKAQSPTTASKVIKQSDGGSEQSHVLRAVLKQQNSDILDKSYLEEINNSENYESGKPIGINQISKVAGNQRINEANKQKFMQKNLSFAIIQSENALSVSNLASGQHVSNFGHHKAQYNNQLQVGQSQI